MNEKNLMPVLFIGHGSPLNATQYNEFTKSLTSLGTRMPRPKAVLCISAHWMTKGTWVTGMQRPKTIHDFYGFPQELFNIQYPAPGNVELAQRIKEKIKNTKILNDEKEWGLDHGTWSVLRHLYPQADIPILQLSLDMSQDAEFHYKLGKELSFLRNEDVLIIGSGDIIHNLRTMNWDKNAPVHPWAQEFEDWVLENIKEKNFSALRNEVIKHPGALLSIPSWDHYFPLLYVLGATQNEDKFQMIYQGIEHSSISMTTFTFS